MKTGDKVIPIGFPLDSQPGIVRMVGGKAVVVMWKMGSTNWNWTATHRINELAVLEAPNEQ